jgi:hypothetical protein
MRRATALAAMAGLIQLTTLDARTACDRHGAAELPATGTEWLANGRRSPAPGHEHQEHHPSAQDLAQSHMADAVPDAPDHAPASDVPSCCMLGGTCVSTTFASSLRDAPPRGDQGTRVAEPAQVMPSSAIRAPEPPPPRVLT